MIGNLAVELAGKTLGEALEYHAANNGDLPALLHESRTLSWSELDEEVNRVAELLASRGVVKGDVVGFMMSKRPELVVGFFACGKLGAVMAPVNFKLHPDHIRDQFKTGDIRTLFLEKTHDKILHSLLPILPDPKRIFYVGEAGSNGEGSYSESDALLGELPDVQVAIEDTVYLNYTSGTTGQPKGAVTSHRSIMFNGLTAFDRAGPDGEKIDGLGFDETHRFMSMFSVFAHPHEIFHRSILCGGAFIVLDTLSPRVTAATIERFGVSWMMAVPSFYEMLLDHANADNTDISSLRILESGGAYVSADTLERLELQFSASFMPVWGSTETTGVAVAMRADRPRVLGTTGKPVAGYEVRIVDTHGRDCSAGETGEMIVRGEGVVSEYLNNKEETEALFVDGWYHTRDLMQWTDDGFIQFVGRRSEMLKIGGIRVYPLEIEKVLKDHPEVRDVVVVRAEERIRGEVARAVVQVVKGSEISARQLRQYCKGRLAVYKIPRIIEFWSEVPKLPNGKVNKHAVVAVGVDAKRDER
jgi:long-chain acyl-CoA synthetase